MPPNPPLPHPRPRPAEAPPHPHRDPVKRLTTAEEDIRRLRQRHADGMAGVGDTLDSEHPWCELFSTVMQDIGSGTWSPYWIFRNGVTDGYIGDAPGIDPGGNAVEVPTDGLYIAHVQLALAFTFDVAPAAGTRWQPCVRLTCESRDSGTAYRDWFSPTPAYVGQPYYVNMSGVSVCNPVDNVAGPSSPDWWVVRINDGFGLPSGAGALTGVDFHVGSLIANGNLWIHKAARGGMHL